LNWASLQDREERLLGRILSRQAEKIGDQPYLMAGADHYSYGRVDELARSYAAGLRELGVGRGDTVALFMDSCPEFVFAAFGANKLGAIWVPTNTDYKGEWLRSSLEDGGAKLLLTDAHLLPRLAELGPELPFERLVVRRDCDPIDLGVEAVDITSLAECPGPEPDVEIAYGDTAAVLWTSGTTGRSKGVMQSHNAWIRGAVSGAHNAGAQEGDVLYNCLPMYNSAAWVTNIYRALVTGLPVGMDPRFSATEFWDRCRYYGATMTFTLGAMHIFLWQAPRQSDDADNPIRSASMVPMPDDLIGPFRERFAIERIDQGYGQSEVMGLLARTDDGRREWKPSALGEPVEGIDVKLLDDDDLEVPPGEVGEFCVRPTEPYAIFNGYLGQPEATLSAYRNLWYHTGDLGRRDADGEYFFVDRKSDFMRYKGRNVSSFAVEAAVSAHPAVKEVAAHGVVSKELASEAEIKIVVVRKAGEDVAPEALARFVNDNAPHFFVPRYIEFVDELPHTPTGRVQKYRLRQRGVTPATWDAQAAGFIIQR
jgi:crotonobetaine/carnitine-CoA ligase